MQRHYRGLQLNYYGDFNPLQAKFNNKEFVYTMDKLDQLELSLSPERLAIYKKLASNDLENAIRLYVWNTAISEALYSPIQGIEVLTRNAFNKCFTSGFGANWYDNPKMRLGINLQQMINKAKEHISRQNKHIHSGTLVPELSLGFWVGLLGRHFETHLWRPHLYSVFINAPKPLLRNTTHEKFTAIQKLRNRIAHHEPILQRNLIVDYESILDVSRWICPTTAQWIECHSRFYEVFGNIKKINIVFELRNQRAYVDD